MSRIEWKGVFPATPTPFFDDYSINEEDLRKCGKWLASIDGVKGLVCNGHAGEVTTLTREEKKRIVEILVDEVGDKLPIIGAVNCDGTLDTIKVAQDAEEAGAKGILLQPSNLWLRAKPSRETIVQYHRDVADAINIDIAVQIYTDTSKAFYDIETLLELSKISRIKAYKLGNKNMAMYERDVRILKKKAPHVAVMSCLDQTLVTSLYQNVDGCIVGFACFAPELIVEAWNAIQTGDYKKVRECDEKLYYLSEAVYGVEDIAPEGHGRAKEALRQRGVIQSSLMRRPVLPFSQDTIDYIAQAIKKAGLQKVSL